VVFSARRSGNGPASRRRPARAGAAINRNGRIGEFAAFEDRQRGTRGALNNRRIDPGGVYLRLEWRNHRLLGYTSKDGKSWSRLERMEPTYPSALKVGLYAINGCTDPMSVRFEDFQFTEGKATAKARTRRR
jgi:hypothetical protein